MSLLFRHKVPQTVLTRMWSRAFSKTCLNLSRRELRACQNLFSRSGFKTEAEISRLFLPAISQRNFSTSSRKLNDKKQSPDDEERNERFQRFMKIGIGLILFINLYTVLAPRPNNDNMNQNGPTSNGNGNQQTITWNDFYYNFLQTGEVESMEILPDMNIALVKLKQGALYKGQPVQSLKKRIQIPEGLNVESKVREFEEALKINPQNGIPITYNRRGELTADVLGLMLFLSLFAFMGWVLRRPMSGATKGSGGMMNPFQSVQKAKFTLVSPLIRQGKGVKFADVAGLQEAKVEVKEFVDFLKNPEKYKELGAKPPKGAILFGPPGCGKTMLAKAVANESNVPFLSMNGSEFIEMIGGLGASRVRDLFKSARERAPAIIYIDEIDAIGRKRSEGMGAGGGGGGEQEQTLNQLLVEMDGINSGNSGIIVLSSTNRSDVLDKALLRPGRFDRQITIDLPTVIERKEILEQHMKGVKLNEKPEIYSERLATLTPGFSGADLANLVNEAALHAARVKNNAVMKDDLEYAIERVIAGPEKKNNALGPNDRKTVAYHESGHALVGWMLKHTDALLKVTIIPRTSMALGFAQYTPQDKKLYSPDEFMDRMCMALGGRVAESIIFNKVTTGAQNDLEKVTQMAYNQIKYFGFNEKVGLLSFDESGGGKKPYSKKLQSLMDQEARQMIAEAYKRTETLLLEHKDLLEKMAQELLQRETLNYDDVEKLIGPPPHGKKHLVSPVEYENSIRNQSEIGKKEAAGV